MLTKKSMMFDGEYIENLVEGYTTIDVGGRESTDIEVDSIEIGKRDGSVYRSRRYKSRTLTISFAIEGEDAGFNSDNEDLIEKMNQLNAVLDTEEEVQIIFADEPDKFYLGIRHGETNASMSLGVITGSFDILCSDPFKYSVEEYIAEPEIDEEDGSRTFLINYEGTRRSYPTYEAHFYTQDTSAKINDSDMDPEDIEDEDEDDIEESEDETTEGNEDEVIAGSGSCGYVAFFNEQERILQFGDPSLESEPEDKKAILKKLVDQNFKKKSTWSTNIQNAWHSMSNNQPLSSLGSSFPIYQTGSFGVNPSKPNKESEAITGTLLAAGHGDSVNYKLTYRAFSRTSGAVKLKITITSSKITKAVGKEAVLVAIIRIGDFTKQITLKKGSNKSKTAWKKGHKISTSTTFWVSGLSTQTDYLSGIKFRVARDGIVDTYRQCTKKDKFSKRKHYFTKSGSNYNSVNINEKEFNKNKTKYYIVVDTDKTIGRLPTVSCSKIAIPTYIVPKVDTYYLSPSDFGTYTKGYFHGPTVYRDIPKDAAGDVGWANFTASFNTKISCGKTSNDLKQCGAVFCGVITGTYSNGSLTNPKVLAGVIIQKTKSGKKGQIRKIVNGKFNGDPITINLDYKNLDFGINRKLKQDFMLLQEGYSKKKVSKIRKYNKKEAKKKTNIVPPKKIVITKKDTVVTFVIGRNKYTVKGVSASLKAYRISFGIFAYSGMPRMDWMGIYRADFKPSTVGTIEATVPFTTGDDLIADSSTGTIMFNNTERPGLGALGNDWEGMYLSPGLNQIGTSYSEWCNTTEYRRCNGDDFYDSTESYYILSDGAYKKVTITAATFNANKDNYYVLESCVPSFRIRYREVFV